MRWKTFAAATTLAALAAMPMMASAQDIFTTMPQPEQGYATTLYRVIPAYDQPGFITWLGGFESDQQLLVIRTLRAYSMDGTHMNMFMADTTPTKAMPVLMSLLTTDDQPAFRTFWSNLTPDQQTSFVTYARYVGPAHHAGMMGNQETTGMAAQPMSTIALNMAVAFAPFLPEADRATFTDMATTTPPAELGGMAHFLSTLTADQAGMVVRAISKLNEMGRAGNNKPNDWGIGDYDAKKLISRQLDSSDMSSFESMYSGMDDQQKSTLLQLARDAYNGGLNDLGATMTN